MSMTQCARPRHTFRASRDDQGSLLSSVEHFHKHVYLYFWAQARVKFYGHAKTIFELILQSGHFIDVKNL